MRLGLRVGLGVRGRVMVVQHVLCGAIVTPVGDDPRLVVAGAAGEGDLVRVE